MWGGDGWCGGGVGCVEVLSQIMGRGGDGGFVGVCEVWCCVCGGHNFPNHVS